ncbi:MAG: hypothetical protein R3A11_08415 [Bdellovibrionota bacterium]
MPAQKMSNLSPLQLQRMIWSMIFSSIFFLGILSKVLIEQSIDHAWRSMVDPQHLSTIKTIFYVVVSIQCLLAYQLPTLFENWKSKNVSTEHLQRENETFSLTISDVKRQKHLPIAIARYALLESCAMFGLVLSQMSGNIDHYVPFALIAATEMIMIYPKKDTLD